MRCFFFFQAEDGIRDLTVTGVQTCALPIYGATLVRIPVGGLGGVDQLVRDLPSHHRVRPDGALEVGDRAVRERSEEHTSELQSQSNLVCRLLLEKKTDENGEYLSQDHHQFD